MREIRIVVLNNPNTESKKTNVNVGEKKCGNVILMFLKTEIKRFVLSFIVHKIKHRVKKKKKKKQQKNKNGGIRTQIPKDRNTMLKC